VDTASGTASTPATTAALARAHEQVALLRRVIEAAAAVSTEVDTERVLQRIVEAASSVTGARYAALGVLDPSRTYLQQFVTAGIAPQERAAIGELPRGRGVLGALIRDARPLRLADIRDDPRAVGFPPGHPPMRSFLGVPVLLRGAPFGNLYLTEKRDGEFTEQDEEAVQLLAALAAGAIEHTRIIAASRRWARRVEAMDEIIAAISAETRMEPLLELVAERLQELVDARLVVIHLLEDGDTLRTVAAAGDARGSVGAVVSAETKARQVLARGRSERVDSTLDDPEIDPKGAAARHGIRAGMWIPLISAGKPLGILIAGDRRDRSDPRFSAEDLRIAETFADRVSVIINTNRRVSRQTVQAIIDAQEIERGRLSRELHDETGQALTSILLAIGAIERAGDLEAAKQQAEATQRLIRSALEQVRSIAVALRPPALDDYGVAPALQRLIDTAAASSGTAIDLALSLPENARFAPATETALYRIVQEAVANAIRHANATSISVAVSMHDRGVVATIEDNGRGFEPSAVDRSRLGVVGMRERAAVLGGEFSVESEPAGGTTVRVRLPAAGGAQPAAPDADRPR
jgi:signal transduction histidine kinase